jgi:hypothetical protein
VISFSWPTQLFLSSSAIAHSDYKAGLVFQELVIENVPCLEKLIPSCAQGAPRTIKVRVAPKLKVFGYLSSKNSEIVFGSILIKVKQLLHFGDFYLHFRLFFLEVFHVHQFVFFQEMIPIRFTASVRTVK